MSARAWGLAARPRTLPVAVVPVLVGSAIAHARGALRPGPAIAALAGALLIQIGTNLANDVFDHEKGADGADRVGPTRAVASGLLRAGDVKAGVALSFALAMLVGVYLTTVAGWPVVAIGLASIAAGFAYTGGPWPLAYNGLGELFVLLFFGLVAVSGTVFVQAGAVPAVAPLAAVPVGALATAILVVNNVRDRVTDARVGKRTLAVRFGRRFGVAEYVVLLGAAYAVPVAMAATGLASRWVLLPLATAPLAVRTAVAFTKLEGAALNGCLADTARVLLAYGVLFAAGLAG